MIAISDHVEVAVAESVEAVAEHRRIQELVRAEHVDRFVCDDRPRQQHPIPRFCAETVHTFARGNIVRLDLVPFVADDEIGVPSGKLFFHPPRGFVVDDGDLQAMCRNLS